MSNLFNQIALASAPEKLSLKLYKFKPSIDSPKEDEIETAIAESLDKAVLKNPKAAKMLIHSITK